MAPRPLPPVEFLRECFSYDPETGVLTWKTRPESHFSSAPIAKAWNSKMAGRPALAVVNKTGHHAGEVSYLGESRNVYAHRVAFALMTGEEPEIVDHKNLKPADNRWPNLRAATLHDNARNAVGRRGKILPKGVFECGKKFAAAIHEDGKRRRLGRFNCPTRAFIAYCAAARVRHGEFFNSGLSRPS